MKEIALTKGKVTIVDDEDYEFLSSFKWHFSRGYAWRNITIARGKGTTISMHRVIMGLEMGDERQADHINGNKLDNRRSNLRICSNAENQRNTKTPTTNTSGFKVVNLLKGRWRASIWHQNKQHYLGRFDTPEEAHATYCKAASELYGEFASDGRRAA